MWRVNASDSTLIGAFLVSLATIIFGSSPLRSDLANFPIQKHSRIEMYVRHIYLYLIADNSIQLAPVRNKGIEVTACALPSVLSLNGES